VESPFAAVRLRTAAAKRFKKVENATAVIWKTLLIAEKTFRRLDAPELLADVASGVVYVNGVRASLGHPAPDRVRRTGSRARARPARAGRGDDADDAGPPRGAGTCLSGIAA